MTRIKSCSGIHRSIVVAKCNSSTTHTYFNYNQHTKYCQSQLCHNFSSSNHPDPNSSTTNKRKRRNPQAKPTKHEKRIIHIQQNIKHKSSLRRRNEHNEMFNDVIVKPLKPITEIVTSDRFQSEIIDKVTSFQKKAQEFLLPESLRHSRPSHEERFRNAVVMDNKWWTWNIALCCLPAILVAIVCEYHKEEAREYFERMNRMNRMNGRNNNGVGGHGSGMSNTRANKDDSYHNENFLNNDDRKSFVEKVTEAFKLALFGIQPDLPNNISTPELSLDESSLDNKSKQRSRSSSSPSLPMVQVNDQQFDSYSNQESIEELLNRMKALEDKLGIKNEKYGTIQDKSKIELNDEYTSASSDIAQSNIRRRIEARNRKNLIKIDLELKEKQQQKQEQQQQQQQQQHEPKEIIWSMVLRQFLHHKMYELYDKGLNSALEMAKVASTRKHENSEKTHEKESKLDKDGHAADTRTPITNDMKLSDEKFDGSSEKKDMSAGVKESSTLSSASSNLSKENNNDEQNAIMDQDMKEDVNLIPKQSSSGMLKKLFAFKNIFKRNDNPKDA